MNTEIKAEFEKSGFSLVEEDQILQKCLIYCINYKLSPADLVANWEIYYLNSLSYGAITEAKILKYEHNKRHVVFGVVTSPNPTKLTCHPFKVMVHTRQLNGLRIETSYMDGFLTHLQNEQKEKFIEEPNLHIYSSSDIDMLHSDEQDDDNKNRLPDTPNHLYERPFLESNEILTLTTSEKLSSTKRSELNSRITPFGQRMSKFVSQFTFNVQVAEHSMNTLEHQEVDEDVIRRVPSNERCLLNIHHSLPEPGCRFMYDKIEDRFNFLEQRIRKHSNAFATFGLYGEPCDATLASQKNILAVGMICCDGEGRLNDKSIMLQGSVELSCGQRVRVDIQKLQQFSFFPGQVIGIEGHNPSGHCLVAYKLIESLPITCHAALPPTKKQAMDREQNDSQQGASRLLSAVIAAGPFTTTDNMLFEPFKELLAYATRRQPQLLILMGPFVDSEHPEIKNGTTNRTFDEIFHFEILQRLQDYAQYMGPTVRVILVPSTRDANHDFVFPQPSFDIDISDDAKPQISCLANPSIFSANEIMVGCCTVDILKQLSSEEISRNSADAPTDRLARLSSHLLSQHSFYPLYPPSASVPLDLSLAPEALDIPSTLDLLVLPSDLAPFVKVLDCEGRSSGEESIKCLCLNPGRVAKGIGGGTFVDLNYLQDPTKSYASIIRI